MHKIYCVHLDNMSIDIILGTVYNNLNIKQNNPSTLNQITTQSKRKAGNNMTRLEELEKVLEAVCGQYENDCSKCPKKSECEEYSHICQSGE